MQENPPTLCQPFANPVPTLRQPFANPLPTFSANLSRQPLSKLLFPWTPGTRLETQVNGFLAQKSRLSTPEALLKGSDNFSGGCVVLCILVAQCSATPAIVAATPQCSATPFLTQISVRHLPVHGGGRCDTKIFRGCGATPVLHLQNAIKSRKSAATRVARQGVPAIVCN